MKAILDATYLIAYLHPNPGVPTDREGRPLAQLKERVNHLIAELGAASTIVGIPTPALAEVLVRAGAARGDYIKILTDTYRFEIMPFGTRAAIESGELIEKIKSEGHKSQPSAKIKFDVQIVSIAKAESADVIYSDDKDIEALGRRLGIRVVRFCDLPLPPPPREEKPRSQDASGQYSLPIEELPRSVRNRELFEETEKDGQDGEAIAPEETVATAAEVRGSGGGSAEGETIPETPIRRIRREIHVEDESEKVQGSVEPPETQKPAD